MALTAAAIGVGITAVAFLGRAAAKYGQAMTKRINLFSEANKFYKGGFEPNMTPREASLILGISSSADQKAIAHAAKKIHRLNHPDKGGSPYIGSKIGEAVRILTNK